MHDCVSCQQMGALGDRALGTGKASEPPQAELDPQASSAAEKGNTIL